MAKNNTIFVKLKAKENFNYKFGGEVHEFSEGDVFSVDKSLANIFINDVGKASKMGRIYEVEDADTRIITPDVDQEGEEEPEKEDEKELGYRDLQKIAKEHDISANQSKDELKKALEGEDLI